MVNNFKARKKVTVTKRVSSNCMKFAGKLIVTCAMFFTPDVFQPIKGPSYLCVLTCVCAGGECSLVFLVTVLIGCQTVTAAGFIICCFLVFFSFTFCLEGATVGSGSGGSILEKLSFLFCTLKKNLSRPQFVLAKRRE